MTKSASFWIHGMVCVFLVSASAPAQAMDGKQLRADVSLKHLPVSSDGRVYLSLGGEIRERFESYSEPYFGVRGVEADD